MYLEPNCDMDLEVYKDWLYEFNANDDLREINPYCLITNCFCYANDQQGDLLAKYFGVFSNNHDDFYGDAREWSVEFRNISDGDGSAVGTWGVGNYDTLDQIEYGEHFG